MPEEFLFTIPPAEAQLSGGANLALQMGAMASRLVQEERTRTDHPDGRAENVAEHTCMLAKVAPELAELLYPNKLDANLVARFASLHDDLEAYVGDTPTDHLSAKGFESKEQREAAGLQQLLKEYGHFPSYARLVAQYEEQQVPEARFVRAVDKLMVILIHIPNHGAVILNGYSRESFIADEQRRIARLRGLFPDFPDIIDLRAELSTHLVSTLWPAVA